MPTLAFINIRKCIEFFIYFKYIYMKKIIINCLMLSLFITACGDDNASPSCDTTDVAATIVGTWAETPISGMGNEVTFSNGMSGFCTEASLFSTELNGDVSTTFTWALNVDNSIITLDYSNGLSVNYNVGSVECDNFDLELFGFTVTLSRK